MELRTFRARTLSEALRQVRAELGPDASVLHTREVAGGLWTNLTGAKQIEVTASADLQVPSRLQAPANADQPRSTLSDRNRLPSDPVPRADLQSFRDQFHADATTNHFDAPSPWERFDAFQPAPPRDRRSQLARLRQRLLASRVEPGLARELIDALGRELSEAAATDDQLRERLVQCIAADIAIHPPIQASPGKQRLAALVGPTGVGKTTTIAKLAASFRLREQVRVGLITVDTYRIAAVNQIRTYAEIIDAPLEVVSTPREMRQALDRLSHLDLVLMDTAGRSPRDESRLSELRSLLAVARPDEVHLVLSAVTGVDAFQTAAERFASVGATALVLTKLDEAAEIGGLLPLLRGALLPISYVTDGQNVPEDIRPADWRMLAEMIVK